MEEKKLTDEEIVKALEFCINNVCSLKCPIRNDTSCVQNLDGLAVTYRFSDSIDLTYDADDAMICQAVNDSPENCPNGTNGTSVNSCSNISGIGADNGEYNYIYVWSIPYRVNKLSFGEAGQAGEYKTAKINKITGPLEITLGQGGKWNNTSWQNNQIAPNGTDTVVKMQVLGDLKTNVVVARGGKGGSPSSDAEKYDLCLGEEGKCRPNSDWGDKISTKDDNKGISCCNKERGTRSTKDIVATAIKYSLFENIRALVGDSEVIGLGAGRGGEGSGTRAGYEEVFGDLQFYNISACESGDNCLGKGPLPAGKKTITAQKPTPNENAYKNTALSPSELYFKGGDGAVILTW